MSMMTATTSLKLNEAGFCTHCAQPSNDQLSTVQCSSLYVSHVFITAAHQVTEPLNCLTLNPSTTQLIRRAAISPVALGLLIECDQIDFEELTLAERNPLLIHRTPTFLPQLAAVVDKLSVICRM